eukprot:5822771-Pleurochrysis_carterae.AAC.1
MKPARSPDALAESTPEIRNRIKRGKSSTRLKTIESISTPKDTGMSRKDKRYSDAKETAEDGECEESTRRKKGSTFRKPVAVTV